MAVKDYNSINNDIRGRNFANIYLLHGEEAFFIDNISKQIENNLLSEEEKDFNQSILYGKDASVDMITDACRRVPMMAEKQLIIVREAQSLKKIEDLANYMAHPTESTVLVLCYKYKSLDKRKALYKSINKIGDVFESKKLYDNQVEPWISNYLKSKKYQIDVNASRLLTAYLGNNLNKLVMELDKLCLNVDSNTVINANHISQFIGISKEYNIFELQNAIGSKNITKSLAIINYFSANTKDFHPIQIISILYPFFNKVLLYHYVKNKSNAARSLGVNPFFIKDYQIAANNYRPKKIGQIFSLLREYDLKLKGVDTGNTSLGELLKEMVFKIVY